MFDLASYTSHYVVQLFTLVLYVVLILVVFRLSQNHLKKPFLIFLTASAVWSFVSLAANLPMPFEEAVRWAKLVPLFVVVSLFAHSIFIASFVNKSTGWIVKLGVILTGGIAALIFMGYIPERFVLLENGIIYRDYGSSLILLSIASLAFMSISVVLLIKSFRVANDPERRNRIAYMLAGVGCIVAFGLIWRVFPVTTYAVDHIGNMCNVLVITYAIVKHQLLDIKLVIRKGIVFTGISIFVTASFLVLVIGVQRLIGNWSTSGSIVVTLGMVILFSRVFNPLRLKLEKLAEKLFYGQTYDYRLMLRNFAHTMSNVIDLQELADAMLTLMTNALRTRQASLVFPSNGYFTAQFAQRLVKGEPVIPIRIRSDSPIISWLEEEDRPLSVEAIEISPEFKGVWQEDRDNIKAAQVELLCPIKRKKKLTAILVISKKHKHGFYDKDDIDMIMTLASEAAVAIENAELYARAKERANTDELTGLFNHRYFHLRLQEEINRASRFGEIFSLLFLDLDLFKNYNDIRGHLAGDEILKEIGKQLSESIRDTDICFRYGGDEFALILPQTQLSAARKVGERIRRKIESKMDLQGILMTCSLGLASWPTDGVMKEELVQAADAALYYAKQTGKNRICLACEVALSEVLRMQSGLRTSNSAAVLNTIYALASTVDAKDHYTYGHSKKVSKYATDIAEALGYSAEGLERIHAAALLHDIGKIGIADRLLQKSGALSPNEWELIRTHPDLGVAILRHIEDLGECLAAVKYHHERYDGKGYPAGLKGENIPLDARILTVADSYDAMTSERPYRQSKMTYEDALQELKQCAGKQFDPSLVEVFSRLCSHDKALTEHEHDIQDIIEGQVAKR